MLRLILAVVVFSVTLGGLFLGGGLGSEETAQVPVLDLIAQATPTAITKKTSAKTASILDSIKTLIVSSANSSPTPDISISSTPSLPPLQKLNPTPTPDFTLTPSTTPPPPSAIPTPSAMPVTTPSPTPEPSSISFTESIYVVSNEPLIFKQKSTAELQLQTYPQTPCSIKVTWPSGSVSTAQSLAPQTSDDSGFMTWTWGVNWNTKLSPPSGKIDLSCTYDSQNYSKSLSFTVTAP